MADQPQTKPPRALGVIRLSVESDESTSPERQRQAIQSWAGMTGAELVGIAEDVGTSGAVAPEDREDLGRWFKPPLAGTFDTLVAMKIDRLSRDLEHFVGLTKRFRVVTTAEGVDTGTKIGKFIAQILGMFAEFERGTIADRVRDSMAYLRRVGRWRGGWAWYGYQAVKVPGQDGYVLVHDPFAVDVIRDMTQRVIAGESMRSIQRDLNDNGVPTPRDRQRVIAGRPSLGKDWSQMTVAKLLRSRRILGQNEFNGSVVRGSDGLPVQYGDPIITETDWKRVQAALDARSSNPTRTRSTGFLLDIAFCSECKSKMYHKDYVSGGKRYRYCLCRNSGDTCTAKRMYTEDIEMFLEDEFLHHVGDLEEQEQVSMPAEDHSAELDRARRNLTELRAERDRGEYEYPGGDADYDERRVSLVEMVKRLSALPQTPARTELRPTGKTYREQWVAGDRDERRALLLRSGIRVYASRHPDNIRVTYMHIQVPEDLRRRMSDAPSSAEGLIDPELIDPFDGQRVSR